MSEQKLSLIETLRVKEKRETKSDPTVSIVIPVCIPDNIQACLNAIKLSNYPNIEVIITINSPSKRTIKEILSEIEKAVSNHPIKKRLRIIKVNRALGFAAACNLGFSHSKGRYVLFLNDDTIIADNLINELVEACEANPNIACIQPKILSFRDKKSFDYSGAAGGFIDLYGTPFCAGRIFETVEEDYGQYDDIEDICWASGACILCRKSVLDETKAFQEEFFAHMEEIDLSLRILKKGYKIVLNPKTKVFQEEFFAHMEEIDLSLRILKKGYKIVLNPKTKVYHMGEKTTKKLNINSDFLKYRNNLMMILINFRGTHLVKIILPRIFMDLLNFLVRVYKREKILALNIPKAYFSILKGMRYILQRRRQFSNNGYQNYLRIIFPKSIAILYYLKGFKYFHQLRRFFNA